MSHRRGGLWATVVLALASLLGLWAFLAPLVAPGRGGDLEAPDAARSAEAPLLLLVLAGLCLVVVVASLETGRLEARRVALLGVLLGVNAVLRLVPGPPGFSAVFFLPILCGYIFGADFGFLLGALSMLLSAVLTNGLGPWVPFQMFAAGWIGLAAGWLPDLHRRRWLEIGALALWGLAAGFLFGAVANLWFWPTLEPALAAGYGLDPGAGLAANLAGYGVYYLTTSLWWDTGRAAGNLALLLLVGPPVLRLLRRFRRRFSFRVEDHEERGEKLPG